MVQLCMRNSAALVRFDAIESALNSSAKGPKALDRIAASLLSLRLGVPEALHHLEVDLLRRCDTVFRDTAAMATVQ